VFGLNERFTLLDAALIIEVDRSNIVMR